VPPQSAASPWGAAIAPLDAVDWWMVDVRGGLLKTSDGGQSWQRVQAKLPSASPDGYTLLTVMPVSGNVLWGTASADFGKYQYPVRSTDGGANWSVVELPSS
jgi:hypothetical protein